MTSEERDKAKDEAKTAHAAKKKAQQDQKDARKQAHKDWQKKRGAMTKDEYASYKAAKDAACTAYEETAKKAFDDCVNTIRAAKAASKAAKMAPAPPTPRPRRLLKARPRPRRRPR